MDKFNGRVLAQRFTTQREKLIRCRFSLGEFSGFYLTGYCVCQSVSVEAYWPNRASFDKDGKYYPCSWQWFVTCPGQEANLGRVIFGYFLLHTLLSHCDSQIEGVLTSSCIADYLQQQVGPIFIVKGHLILVPVRYMNSYKAPQIFHVSELFHEIKIKASFILRTKELLEPKIEQLGTF